MCLLTAGVLFARKPAIGFIPGSQRVHHQHSSQGKSSSPGLSTQMQPSSSSSSTASSHGPATSPWAHNTSLNSPPTSDKAGSLGHSAGPVFFLSPSMYTFYRFSNPRPAIRTEASITEKTSVKTKCWAPTADSRTFEVWHIYICSKLQLVILFFWGCVIQRGATTTYCVTMPWTQGAVWRLRGWDVPQTVNVASKQDSSLSFLHCIFICTCCILESNSKSYYQLLPKRICVAY